MRMRKARLLPETTKNYLINIGPGLFNYARQAVLRDWDPNTPRVTREEREVILKTEGVSNEASAQANEA
jgi:hypothetical protein